MIGIEGAREGRRRRAPRHHEDGVVAVADLTLRPLDGPANVRWIRAHGQGERADAIGWDMPLDPLLGRGDLLTHHALGILGEIGVPERVIADLVASAGQVLELARGQLLLVEEAVRRIGAGEHEEGRRVAELRMAPLEGLEDAHGAVGIHDPFPVLLDQLELARRGVVEGEDDGRGAARDGDLAVHEVVEGHQTIAALPEPLEITTKVARRAGPPLLGLVDLVVLEDHHAAELIRRELPGRDGDRPGQGAGEQAGAEREDKAMPSSVSL